MVDVHTLAAGHRNIWKSCSDKVFLKDVSFSEFNLKFDSSDGFLDHYVFSSGKQLFNLFVLILFLYLNAGNLNLFLRALHSDGYIYYRQGR